MTLYCEVCDKHFKNEKYFKSHQKSKRHLQKETITGTSVKTYKCDCGKLYLYRQSLYLHKKQCYIIPSRSISQEITELKKTIASHEIEKMLMREKIEKLSESRCEGTIVHNHTTNIENQNNITININAFGKENLQYITEDIVIKCIDKVSRSIPCLIEKIHFDPDHPENHNIKITNKKLPYACVMGENRQWKTVDKKYAIDSLVDNGYSILDETYNDTNVLISSKKRNHFKQFQNKYDSQEKELIKQLKTEIELLLLNNNNFK